MWARCCQKQFWEDRETGVSFPTQLESAQDKPLEGEMKSCRKSRCGIQRAGRPQEAAVKRGPERPKEVWATGSGAWGQMPQRNTGGH